MADLRDFSGRWRSYHSYPTKDDSGEESSEYDMAAHQTGRDVVFESLPQEDGSYMLVRLHVDDDLATGTWQESTSLTGAFKGAVYSGAGQLIISQDGQRLDGQWAGMGIDRAPNKPRIYTGRWMLERRP